MWSQSKCSLADRHHQSFVRYHPFLIAWLAWHLCLSLLVSRLQEARRRTCRGKTTACRRAVSRARTRISRQWTLRMRKPETNGIIARPACRYTQGESAASIKNCNSSIIRSPADSVCTGEGDPPWPPPSDISVLLYTFPDLSLLICSRQTSFSQSDLWVSSLALATKNRCHQMWWLHSCLSCQILYGESQSQRGSDFNIRIQHLITSKRLSIWQKWSLLIYCNLVTIVT